jgi:aspartyl/glutamyl-tRNA(Asn/Gln) amidotransferase C subunit
MPGDPFSYMYAINYKKQVISVVDELKEALEQAIRVVKIEIDHAGQEKLLKELNLFLNWLEPLQKADTGDVDPLLFGHVSANVLRDDQAVMGDLSRLRKVAPNFEGGFYQVPPIIE